MDLLIQEVQERRALLARGLPLDQWLQLSRKITEKYEKILGQPTGNKT